MTQSLFTDIFIATDGVLIFTKQPFYNDYDRKYIVHTS